MHGKSRRNATGTGVQYTTRVRICLCDTFVCMVLACKLTQQNWSESLLWHCMCLDLLYLITNKTQVQIEKKKGKYGIEYSLESASDEPCPRGWGPRWNLGAHAENGVPSPDIFLFNHWLDPLRNNVRLSQRAPGLHRTANNPQYTLGEVTSQNLWSRYDRHFVGITRYNALS